MKLHQIIQCFNQFIWNLKRLLLVIIFQRGLQGLSDKSIKIHAASNNGLEPALNHINTKLQVKLDDYCLKQDKVTFLLKNK